MNREQASEAFNSLVDSLPHPSGSVAIALLDEAGISVTPCRLSKWRNPSHDEAVPLHVVWALQVQAGKAIVSDAMSAAVDRGEALDTCVTILASQATMLASKANAQIAAARCPGSDGGTQITPREAKDALKGIDRAVDALMATRDAVQKLATPERSGP